MARIRTIKPEFFRHEELQRLGPIPMLVFAGIWTQCDKAGNFPWKPRQLKLDILPFIDFDMETVMGQLCTSKVLLKYVHEENEYGHVTGFLDHQVIWGSEIKSKVRWPDFQGRTVDVLRTQEKGIRNKEEGGRNKDIPASPKKHSFEKSEFYPFDNFRASLPEWDEEKCQEYFTRAMGYSKANGGKYLDWRQAVQNWERKDALNPKPFNKFKPDHRAEKRKGEYAEKLTL